MAIYHNTCNGPIEVTKHQLMGPHGYWLVGSPSITDGVASGFSTSNYLAVSPFDTTKPWELGIKFNATNANSILGTLSNSRSLIIRYNTGNQIFVFLSSANAAWDIANGASIPAFLNTAYWLKIQYTGTDYILSYSIDGQNYTVAQHISSNLAIDTFTQLCLGYAPHIGGKLVGSIDLNETYIKVNGKLWFWQPRETEKIVLNNTLVWEKTQ